MVTHLAEEDIRETWHRIMILDPDERKIPRLMYLYMGASTLATSAPYSVISTEMKASRSEWPRRTVVRTGKTVRSEKRDAIVLH